MPKNKNSRITIDFSEPPIDIFTNKEIHSMQEHHRQNIALILVISFPILLGVVFTLLVMKITTPSDTKDLILSVYQVFSPFLGLVLGYYFAKQSRGRDEL